MDVITGHDDHDDLERYLLGMLPDEQRDRIDARLLTDAPLFDALCVVENELAYDYALGLLTPDERRRFEERFLHRPAVRARVRTATDLIDGIRAAEPVRPRQHWWLYAAAAAGIVLVAWLVRDEVRLRRAGGAETTVTSVPAAEPAPVPAAPQPPPAAPAATSSQPAQTAVSVVAVVLQPGVLRSSGAPSRVRLRQGETLRLELALPASSAPMPGYRASIRNPDDVEAWAGTASASKDGRGVTVSVPAASLPPNDYEITLYAIRADGSSEEIASYGLSTAGR